MENILLYIIAALCLVLLVVVILLITSVSNLKKEVWENAQQTQASTQNMQSNLQNSILTSVNQTVSLGYSQVSQSFDTKLSNSFNTINQGLGELQKGLGQMQGMASGVEDLRKVLSNVKTRGILGEIQLGNILEQILAPSMYEQNVETIPGSGKRVEFAVKLPGTGDIPVYLPIDSKFPGDAYAHLVDASRAGDENELIAARKLLVTQFKNEADDIKSKYVQTPYTTDFGIMFLPVESLYLEAVSMGMIELLQREYNVVIAGPSTMSALLNALGMGFKTLAIQKNADQVWMILNDVKSEFDKFEDVLSKLQKDLNASSEDLDKLVGTRTRAIQRTLKKVQSLEDKDGDGVIDFTDI